MQIRSIAALALGLALLAATGWRVWQTKAFLSGAVRTSGTIVEATAHPLIGFATPEGTRVTFTQNGFVSRPVGASVPVAYDASNPSGTARAASFWPLWGTALWLLPLGLGLTILSLAGAVFGLRGH